MQRKNTPPAPRVRRAAPRWPEAADGWQEGERPPRQRHPRGAGMAEEPVYQQPPLDEPPCEDAYEDGRYDDRSPQPEVIATNTAIRLTCTLCAMCGLLAAFICWAEKESRAIRHFAVQSVAVMALHALCVLLLALIASLMGGIPFLGFMLTLVCWLVYFVVVMVTAVIRVRMMLHAWRGIRFTLPGLWRKLERFC